MAKSLAFWLEGSKNDKTSVELHFNFWRLNTSSKKNEINYLDVGVKFTGVEDISSINIFFPFEVTKEKFIDKLAETILKDTELISAIFNARVDNAKEVNPNVKDIVFVDEKTETLRVFGQIGPSEPGSNDGVNFLNQEEGTTLSFPKKLFTVTGKDKDSPVYGYFRFRIKLTQEDKKNISQLYVSKDAKLLSRMESIEIVDFRVNEVRNLPPKIVGNINNSCITGVHFFLIRETNSEHKLSHSEFKRCRILEKFIWDKYLNVSNVPSAISIPDQMLIYHWKESVQKPSELKSSELKYLDNFSAFAKFSTIIVTHWTLLGFLIFLLFWGALSGVIGNGIYSIPSRFVDAPKKDNCQNEDAGAKTLTDNIKGKSLEPSQVRKQK